MLDEKKKTQLRLLESLRVGSMLICLFFGLTV